MERRDVAPRMFWEELMNSPSNEYKVYKKSLETGEVERINDVETLDMVDVTFYAIQVGRVEDMEPENIVDGYGL